MTSISFYHLKTTPLEKALPKLLEKIIGQGLRVHILTESEEQAEALAIQLWTYHPGSFLPHGTQKDGFLNEHPIFLSPGEDNVNDATVLVVVDGRVPEKYTVYSRVLDMFDASEDAMIEKARTRWRFYAQKNIETIYWSQKEDGSWQKMTKE